MKFLTRTFAVMLIIAATFLVYWPALRNGFVWDDTALVLRDPLIRSWTLIGESFRHFLFLDATASNFYRPMQRLSFIADYQFYGFDAPWGWHLTSILVHAGAAVALFFVAEKLLALSAAVARWSEPVRRGIALLVAGLWAIHPLHTSAVTYIAGRADPLAALFGFTALALGLASLDQRPRAGLWKAGAGLGFLLALLSKESGVVFPLIWVLVLIWRQADRRTFATWTATFLVVFGSYGALRSAAHKTPPPTAPPTPLAVRPILAARALAEYAGLVVAPVTLRMERDVSTKPQGTFEATMQNARRHEFQTLAGVLVLLGLGAWVWWTWRREPAAAFCLGAAFIAYVPISNAFPLNATVAEHWLYVPSAFLFLAAALSLLPPLESENVRGSAALRQSFGAVFVVWAIVLGTRTFLRQADWRDQRTFIERTIAAGGDSARMLMNLGNVESNAGHPEKAIALYREALRRSPDQSIIWLGFASVLVRAHDLPTAREALGRAAGTPLFEADVLMLRALLEQAERGTDPEPALRAAVEIAPENWNLRKRHVEMLIDQGRIADAARELGSFVETHPFRAESWKLLGRLLERMEQPTAARTAYVEAMQRDVRDAESKACIQRLRVASGG